MLESNPSFSPSTPTYLASTHSPIRGPASARSIAAGLAQAAWQPGGCEEEGSVDDVNLSRSQRRWVSLVEQIGRGMRGRGAWAYSAPLAVVLQMGKATHDLGAGHAPCKGTLPCSASSPKWWMQRAPYPAEAPDSPLTTLPPTCPCPCFHGVMPCVTWAAAGNHCSWPTTLEGGMWDTLLENGDGMWWTGM